MPPKTDQDLGINSWLEDELYQQYLNDRTAVDESWKHVFEDAPNGQSERAPLARSPPRPLGSNSGPPRKPPTPSAASPPKSPRT
jgi:2-oxoglutarate decarboxylase